MLRQFSLCFLALLAAQWAAVVLADDGDETLLYYLSKSDVAVLGQFTSDVIGESGEAGVIHYQADFKVARLIKGPAMGKKGVPQTISVNIVRFEFDKEDELPELAKGKKCILFLKQVGEQEKPSFRTADIWFGVQRPSPTLASSLSRLVSQQAKTAK
jgi:hypothetical protein